MTVAAILLAIEQAAAGVQGATRLLGSLKTLATTPPAGGGAPLLTAADVEAATDRGFAAADKSDATMDSVLDRLRREGKIS